MVDSNENIFPASKRLVEIGAELHRMESVCEVNGCTKLATHHVRFDNNGSVVKNGAQVEVGADQYMSTCRRHYRMFIDGLLQKEKN